MEFRPGELFQNECSLWRTPKGQLFHYGTCLNETIGSELLKHELGVFATVGFLVTKTIVDHLYAQHGSNWDHVSKATTSHAIIRDTQKVTETMSLESLT